MRFQRILTTGVLALAGLLFSARPDVLHAQNPGYGLPAAQAGLLEAAYALDQASYAVPNDQQQLALRRAVIEIQRSAQLRPGENVELMFGHQAAALQNAAQVLQQVQNIAPAGSQAALQQAQSTVGQASQRWQAGVQWNGSRWHRDR